MTLSLKVTGSALLATVFASQVYAADIVVADEPLPDPIVVNEFAWTGFYAGGQLGYGQAEGDLTALGVTSSGELDGILGGGFVGFNYQIDNLVVGVEADLNFTDWNEGVTLGALSGSTETDYIGTIGPRVGYAVDRALFYVEGGYAFTEVETEVSGAGVAFSDSETLNGYFVGAGIDYALTDTIFVGAEYNYADFEDANFNLGGTALEFDDVDAHIFKARVGFKF